MLRILLGLGLMGVTISADAAPSIPRPDNYDACLAPKYNGERHVQITPGGRLKVKLRNDEENAETIVEQINNSNEESITTKSTRLNKNEPIKVSGKSKFTIQKKGNRATSLTVEMNAFDDQGKRYNFTPEGSYTSEFEFVDNKCRFQRRYWTNAKTKEKILDFDRALCRDLMPRLKQGCDSANCLVNLNGIINEHKQRLQKEGLMVTADGMWSPSPKPVDGKLGFGQIQDLAFPCEFVAKVHDGGYDSYPPIEINLDIGLKRVQKNKGTKINNLDGGKSDSDEKKGAASGG